MAVWLEIILRTGDCIQGCNRNAFTNLHWFYLMVIIYFYLFKMQIDSGEIRVEDYPSNVSTPNTCKNQDSSTSKLDIQSYILVSHGGARVPCICTVALQVCISRKSNLKLSSLVSYSANNIGAQAVCQLMCHNVCPSTLLSKVLIYSLRQATYLTPLHIMFF